MRLPTAGVTRTQLLHALPALLLLPASRTLPASAADLDVAFALTPLFQLRGAVAEADGKLFADLLQSPASVSSSGGVKTTEGATIRGLVKKILQQGKPRQMGRDAVDAGEQAGLLDRRRAIEVEGHAREAQELLASILDYERTNSYKFDALGNLATTMRPEELDYYHRALVAARLEIERACACFPSEEVQQAAALVARLGAGASQPGSSNLPSLDGDQSNVVFAGSVIERDAAITKAIAGLPSPVGTALTRGDLQSNLNNAYEERNAAVVQSQPRVLSPPAAVDGSESQQR